METVNIAELKNNLSHYLKKARSGEEVVVKDRNVPVAKIVPWREEHSDELLDLAAQGRIKLGHGYIDEDFWQLPMPKISEGAMKSALEAERNE